MVNGNTRQYRIARRDILSKEFLEECLNVRHLKHHEIAALTGYSRTSVSKRIIYFGLQREDFRKNFPIGHRSGHLVILEKCGLNDKRKMIYRCKCELCGREDVLVADTGINRTATSCNCFRKKINKSHYSWQGCGDLSLSYFNSIKTRCKIHKKDFHISIEYAWDVFLKQEGKCAISGIKLIFPSCSIRKRLQTASIDRIDSKKGYIEGNIQWVHKYINIMKWDLSQKDFIEFVMIIAKYQAPTWGKIDANNMFTV